MPELLSPGEELELLDVLGAALAVDVPEPSPREIAALFAAVDAVFAPLEPWAGDGEATALSPAVARRVPTRRRRRTVLAVAACMVGLSLGLVVSALGRETPAPSPLHRAQLAVAAVRSDVQDRAPRAQTVRDVLALSQAITQIPGPQRELLGTAPAAAIGRACVALGFVPGRSPAAAVPPEVAVACQQATAPPPEAGSPSGEGTTAPRSSGSGGGSTLASGAPGDGNGSPPSRSTAGSPQSQQGQGWPGGPSTATSTATSAGTGTPSSGGPPPTATGTPSSGGRAPCGSTCGDTHSSGPSNSPPSPPSPSPHQPGTSQQGTPPWTQPHWGNSAQGSPPSQLQQGSSSPTGWPSPSERAPTTPTTDSPG